MRMIPRAYPQDGQQQQPPSMVVPSVAPVSDVDPAILSDAAGQRGVSSVLGMPVDVPQQRPMMNPADADAQLGYARQAQVIAQPLQPLQAMDPVQVVPQSMQDPVELRASSNWRVICSPATIEDVRMDSGGASVIVRGQDGRRYAAYIRDVPIIEVGIPVELGVKSERDTRTDRVTTVADIMRL